MADVDKSALEKLVRQVLLEKLGDAPAHERPAAHGVRAVAVPRLGCGLMVMEQTTFPWKLTYDEMDYVIDGRLDILVGGETVSAGPGEVVHIPRGSEIQFSARGKVRFLYFVYPADWQK